MTKHSTIPKTSPMASTKNFCVYQNHDATGYGVPISASSLFSLPLFARASQPAPPISYIPKPPKHSLSSIAGPSLSYRGVALSITGKSSSATRRMTVSEFNETTAPSGTGHPSRRPRMLSVAFTSITFLGMFVNFRQLALFSSGSIMDVDDISIMTSTMVNRKKSTIDLNKNENKEAVKQQEIQRSVSSSSPTATPPSCRIYIII